MKVYESDHVRCVRRLHQNVLDNLYSYKHVIDLLNDFSENLSQAFQKEDESVCIEISNHHPDFLGKRYEEILDNEFTLNDAKLTIAKEYGFKDWGEVSGSINQDFERSVDFLINGNLEGLQRLPNLDKLIKTKSSFGHQATILHYAGSNGVEIWRQKVPENLPEITNWLVKKGANKNAKANFYGGHYTPLALASSSSHPIEAGIVEPLIKSLAIDQ